MLQQTSKRSSILSFRIFFFSSGSVLEIGIGRQQNGWWKTNINRPFSDQCISFDWIRKCPFEIIYIVSPVSEVLNDWICNFLLFKWPKQMGFYKIRMTAKSTFFWQFFIVTVIWAESEESRNLSISTDCQTNKLIQWSFFLTCKQYIWYVTRQTHTHTQTQTAITKFIIIMMKSFICNQICAKENYDQSQTK